MNIIKRLFDISRPVSWVNTAFPFAAGYLVLGGLVDLRLVIGTLFFLIPYNLLMYGINDVFDYESDIKNPRTGGIEGAITPKKYHPIILGSSIALTIPFAAYLMLTGSMVNNLTLLIVLFFVVAYSLKGLRFKEVPVLDSITSSMHFVGPLLYAYSFFEISSQYWLVAVAFFAWGVASQALGAVQDIIPDRQADIKSIATVLGAKLTVRFSLAMYTLAVLLVGWLGGLSLVVAAAGLAYVVNIIKFVSISDEKSQQTSAAWRRFIWLNYAVGAVVTICLVLANLNH